MPLINRREAPQIFGSLSSVFLKKVGDLIKKESPKPYISKARRFRECIIYKYYIMILSKFGWNGCVFMIEWTWIFIKPYQRMRRRYKNEMSFE